MCGIAGIISSNPARITRERLQLMSDAIAHRGPDGADCWINEQHTAGFSHRRLAIIDLSSNGGQPMHYQDRYTIVYNGEIYNYLELRDTLAAKGYRFHSTSDTEVILAAYACYGQECLQHFDGMFAFAIWDKKESALFAARDRFGEKPFFYYHDGDEFLFASEMKSLWAVGTIKEINNTMLLNYLSMGIAVSPVNAAATFYNKLFKLPAAHYLQLNQHTSEIEILPYWKLDKEQTSTLPEEDSVRRFKELLTTSVRRRLRSDVSLGTSLSGGLDSSSIVSIMQSILPPGNNAASFSAIFPGFEKDESAYIKMVTDKFRLTNFTVAPTAENFISTIKTICHHQEEPFQSANVYAQYKVYELAKQHGTVILLDGQGADETLAGYYKYYHWYWHQLIKEGSWLNLSREMKATRKLGIHVNWGVKNYMSAWLPEFTARQLEKRSYIMQKHHPDISPDFFKQYNDRHSIDKPVVRNLNDLLYFNTMHGGLEELLRYADRNSMAHSREVRLPFLQHELVEFIFSLPSHYKIRQGYTKWVLRQSMKNELPEEIVWRKDKTGFEPPQYNWMQEPAWQENILESKRTLVNKGVLKPASLDQKAVPKAAHASGNYHWRYLIAGMILSK